MYSLINVVDRKFLVKRVMISFYFRKCQLLKLDLLCCLLAIKIPVIKFETLRASYPLFVIHLSLHFSRGRIIITILPQTLPLLVGFLLTYLILLPRDTIFSFDLSCYVVPSLTFWSWIEQRDGVWRPWLMIYLRVLKDKCKIDAETFVLFI